MSPLYVPVSPGELLDKITILEIKQARIRDTVKRRHVERELGLLLDAWQSSPYTYADTEIGSLAKQLKTINETLWDLEDRIRGKESQHSFDAEFITLARSVYRNNDARAALKRHINRYLGSDIVEEKAYRDD